MPKSDVVEVPAIGPVLCVANIFPSNMVLPRDRPLRIWGWAEPAEEIRVAFAGDEARATATVDRVGEVVLRPVAANPYPQVLTVRGATTTLRLEDVLVGDVWILGGQGNMEFPLRSVGHGELEAVSANFPQIRRLTMPQGKGMASVRVSSGCTNGAAGPSGIFARGTGTSARPNVRGSFSHRLHF